MELQRSLTKIQKLQKVSQTKGTFFYKDIKIQKII